MGARSTKPNTSGNTKILLEVLEKEVRKWTEIIKNMKSERFPNSYAYLQMCMNETSGSLQHFAEPQGNKEYEHLERKGIVSQLEDKNKEINALKKEIEQLTHKINNLDEFKRKEMITLEKVINDQSATFETHCTNMENLTQINVQLRAERDEFQTRLSKFASDRFLANNPAITDLSDPNRPSKLGEMYLELYNNQWSEAFEALHSTGYSSQETIHILRETLMHCFEFCKKKSDELLVKTGEAIQFLFRKHQKSFKENKTAQFYQTVCVMQQIVGNERQSNEITKEDAELPKAREVPIHTLWYPKHQQAQKDLQQEKIQDNEPTNENEKVQAELKHMRKEISIELVPMVQTAYINTFWKCGCLAKLKPFIEECLFVGWMMVIQSPPMCFYEANVQPETSFDKNMFREFTVTGPLFDYMVWPAMLLHERGQVVTKGFAQGKK